MFSSCAPGTFLCLSFGLGVVPWETREKNGKKKNYNRFFGKRIWMCEYYLNFSPPSPLLHHFLDSNSSKHMESLQDPMISHRIHFVSGTPCQCDGRSTNATSISPRIRKRSKDCEYIFDVCCTFETKTYQVHCKIAAGNPLNTASEKWPAAILHMILQPPAQ